ncbi:MAG TPA: hypothetical protein DF984_01735 [Anaerolineaceae bacterium]|nr:hypothetical protein [Anaerolineaceae bacterium]
MNLSFYRLKKRLVFSGMSILVAAAMLLVSCTPSQNPSGSTAATISSDSATEESPQPTATPAFTPTPATPVQLQVDPADLAGIVVRFVHPWMGEMADALASAASQFSLSNEWDIWVEVEATGGDNALLESVQADLDEGNLPGLIAAYPYALAELDGKYFSVNLTDYFYSPEWGFSPEAQADIPAVFLEQFTDEGHLAALPVASQATVLFYNQTWGQALGFADLPGNAEGFAEQSCAAVFSNYDDENEDNDGTGGWLINQDPEVLASWYAAFGSELPVSGEILFSTEGGQDALGYLKDTYSDGCIWLGRRPEPYFYFANRYSLMYAGTLDQIPYQAGWMVSSGSTDDWTVMGFPGPEGEVMLVDSPGLMVTADTPENQMAAWLFARYLLSPEVQAKLVRSGFSLPVRESALALLADFANQYPQWAQAVEMMDIARPVPISSGWGIGQWVLQDGFYRLLQGERDDLPRILEDVDALVAELETREQ